MFFGGLFLISQCGKKDDDSDSGDDIDDYKRGSKDGVFEEDETITKAKIVTSPHVIIPTIGERLDFKYSFPAESRVIIRIFNVQGRFVTTLVDQYYPSAGTVKRMESSSEWDGRDHLGQIVSPGTYLFHIEANNFKTGATSTDVAPAVVGVNY